MEKRKSAQGTEILGKLDSIKYGGNEPNLNDIIARSGAESPEIQDNLRRSFEKQLINEHLENLNNNLKKANLIPEFSLGEIYFTPSMELPYMENTREVVELSNDFAMPIISVIFGYNDKGEAIRGQFAPLMQTKERYEKKGNLQIVICSKENTNYGPVVPPRGEVQIPEKTLKELNEQLINRGRKTLPQTLTKSTYNSDKVVNYQIFDQNAKFYTVVVLETKKGNKVPMLFNRLGNDGSEGEVSVIKLVDGSYGLVSVPRPLFGKIGIEIPRGMADKGMNKFRELAEETGVTVTDDDFVFRFKMMQDPTTDNVTPDFNVINFSKLKELPEAKGILEKSDDGFENVLTYKTDVDSLLNLIKSNNIYDAHTIGGILTAMLVNEDLIINPMFNNGDQKVYGVILEEVFLPQTGKNHLIVPRGPINSGIKIGEIVPDSGKTRIINNVSLCTQNDLDQNGSNRFISLNEIIKKSKNMEFDIVTLSSLCIALMEKGYLVSKKSAIDQ